MAEPLNGWWNECLRSMALTRMSEVRWGMQRTERSSSSAVICSGSAPSPRPRQFSFSSGRNVVPLRVTHLSATFRPINQRTFHRSIHRSIHPSIETVPVRRLASHNIDRREEPRSLSSSFSLFFFRLSCKRPPYRRDGARVPRSVMETESRKTKKALVLLSL